MQEIKPIHLPEFNDAEAKQAIAEFMEDQRNSAPRFDPFLVVDNIESFNKIIKQAHDEMPGPIEG